MRRWLIVTLLVFVVVLILSLSTRIVGSALRSPEVAAFEDGLCTPMPCWYNIRVGQTLWMEARRQLAAEYTPTAGPDWSSMDCWAPKQANIAWKVCLSTYGSKGDDSPSDLRVTGLYIYFPPDTSFRLGDLIPSQGLPRDMNLCGSYGSYAYFANGINAGSEDSVNGGYGAGRYLPEIMSLTVLDINVEDFVAYENYDPSEVLPRFRSDCD